MILSDRDISHELGSGNLEIRGMRDIGPASVDVYLGGDFVNSMGMRFPAYELWPLQFVLGTTAEIVKLPENIVGQVHGCSSVGRTGLFVQNAGWIDPGFEGQITLELFNASDTCIRLHEGMRIAQLSFEYLYSPSRRPYGLRGRYQGQRGATEPRAPR